MQLLLSSKTHKVFTLSFSVLLKLQNLSADVPNALVLNTSPGNKFKLYGHFKKNTFAHACQEINDNYDINLKFIEKKEGRKVDKIRFTFTPLVAQKIINKKSGEETTIYQKIKRKNIQKIVESKKIQNERALSEQMAFDDINKKLQEVEIEPKSVRRMISSIISKLTYSKK